MNENNTSGIPATSLRSRQEIDAEYTRNASFAGDKAFRVKVISEEMKRLADQKDALVQEVAEIHTRMRELHLEKAAPIPRPLEEELL